VGFLKRIFPVPDTLKVFFALEWVFTFGMMKWFSVYPAGASEQTENLWDHVG
jgi:hypothetical protein